MKLVYEDSSKAKDMYKDYYRHKEAEGFKDHPHLGWCHLILSEYYMENNQLFRAKKHLIKGETIFIESYGGINHPNLAHLYLKKSQFVNSKENVKYDAISKILNIKKESLDFLMKEFVIKSNFVL